MTDSTNLYFAAPEKPLQPGCGAAQQGGIFDYRDDDLRKKHAAIKHAMSNNMPNMAVTQRLIAKGMIGKALYEQIRHQATRWVDISTVFEILPHTTNTVRPSSTRKDTLGIPMRRGG